MLRMHWDTCSVQNLTTSLVLSNTPNTLRMFLKFRKIVQRLKHLPIHGRLDFHPYNPIWSLKHSQEWSLNSESGKSSGHSPQTKTTVLYSLYLCLTFSRVTLSTLRVQLVPCNIPSTTAYKGDSQGPWHTLYFPQLPFLCWYWFFCHRRCPLHVSFPIIIVGVVNRWYSSQLQRLVHVGCQEAKWPMSL